MKGVSIRIRILLCMPTMQLVLGFLASEHPTARLSFRRHNRILETSPTSSINRDVPSELEVHELVWQADPEWYENYVLRTLGKDYCQEQWPIDLTKPKSDTKLFDRKETIPVDTSTKDDSTVLPDEEQPEEESLDATNEIIVPPEDVGRVVVYEKSGSTGTLKSVPLVRLTTLGYRNEDLEMMQSDALSIALQDGVTRPRYGLPPQWKIRPGELKSVQIMENQTIADSYIQKYDEEADLSKRRVSSISDSKKAPAEISETNSISKGDDQSTNVDIVPQDNEEMLDETSPLEKKSNDLDKEGTGRIDSSTESVASSDNSTTKALDMEDHDDDKETDARVLLYRNLTNELTFVPLIDLIKLGYKENEVGQLQSNALAVIVADAVARPRAGIPRQWTVEKGAEGSVEVLPSASSAESPMERDTLERRQRRATRSSTPNDITVEQQPRRSDVADEFDQPLPKSDSKRGKEDSDNQEIRRPRKEPRSNQSDASDTSWKNSNRKYKSDILASRTRRTRQSEEGPKRIYNAREQLNRKAPKSKPDPPDPNSLLWMNMDSFRSLLRKEAELRLRVLGNGWAPNVKQESEWRMDLYKSWLWALHNGVGESIVPPSRYERARKLKMKRMEYEGSPRPAPKEQPSTTKSSSRPRRPR